MKMNISAAAVGFCSHNASSWVSIDGLIVQAPRLMASKRVAASVGLALQKWERGDVQGLFAAILAAWRRLDPVQTKRCK